MAISILSRLADRLILQPSRRPQLTLGKTRRTIPVGRDEVEVWTLRTGDYRQPVDLFVLKFPGTAGRAERSTVHPADHWPDLNAELWAVNPPGYGGSTGQAELRKLAPMAQAVYHELARHAAGRPILVTGNSLGCTSALHLAATVPLAGLILRNPPPIREVILGEHSWWNLGLGTRLLVRHIPSELDTIHHAGQTAVPAIFITSGCDTLILPKYQHQIIEAYAGPKRVLVLPEADHATPLTELEEAEYCTLLGWLRQQGEF